MTLVSASHRLAMSITVGRVTSITSRDVNEARHLEAKAEAEIEARGSRPRPRTRPKQCAKIEL